MEADVENFIKALNEKFGGREHGTDRFEQAGGIKFLRIVAVGNGGSGRSAYCFIALEDGCNKQLGPWKQGDIFRPAGWAGPAKTARGNLFNHLGGLEHCGEYGVAYLR